MQGQVLYRVKMSNIFVQVSNKANNKSFSGLKIYHWKIMTRNTRNRHKGNFAFTQYFKRSFTRALLGRVSACNTCHSRAVWSPSHQQPPVINHWPMPCCHDQGNISFVKVSHTVLNINYYNQRWKDNVLKERHLTSNEERAIKSLQQHLIRVAPPTRDQLEWLTVDNNTSLLNQFFKAKYMVLMITQYFKRTDYHKIKSRLDEVNIQKTYL